MRKIIFIILLSILPLCSFSKTLNFINDSGTYMSFKFSHGGSCVNAIPEKIELQPGQSTRVEINTNLCPSGEVHDSITLYGWPSKYPQGSMGFLYLAMLTNDLSTLNDWTCSKLNDNKNFAYYCYHSEPNEYHPDFKLDANQDSIRIMPGSPQPSAEMSLFTFFNDTENEYYSLSSINGALGGCSTISIGSFQPRSKSNVKYAILKSLCLRNETECKLAVHMSKDCSGSPIATITINIDKEIKQIQRETPQPEHKSAYRVSYDFSASGKGQDIHVATSRFIFLKNDANTNDVFTLSFNGVCALNDYPPLGRRSLLDLTMFDKLWRLCKKNPASCAFEIHKSVDCSGLPVPSIIIDVDLGAKSINNNSSSAYIVSQKTSKPWFSEVISISPK